MQVAGPSRERSGSGGQRLLQRVVRSAPPILSGFRLSRADPDGAESSSASSSRKGSVDKPLPTIPQLFNGFNGFNTSQGSTRLRSGSKSKPPSPTSSSASSSGGSTFSSVSSIATSVHSDKQLTTDGPEIAPQRVTDSRTLHTDVSVGFPKRPKGRSRAGSHPSLETVSALPDGLYKGNIPLQKGWFPSIHWRGLRIEVSLHMQHCVMTLTTSPAAVLPASLSHFRQRRVQGAGASSSILKKENCDISASPPLALFISRLTFLSNLDSHKIRSFAVFPRPCVPLDHRILTHLTHLFPVATTNHRISVSATSPILGFRLSMSLTSIFLCVCSTNSKGLF